MSKLMPALVAALLATTSTIAMAQSGPGGSGPGGSGSSASGGPGGGDPSPRPSVVDPTRYDRPTIRADDDDDDDEDDDDDND